MIKTENEMRLNEERYIYIYFFMDFFHFSFGKTFDSLKENMI
jgi:hypothetical protein